MNEELLQFIWKFGLFDAEQAITTTGEKIEFLSRGVQNRDAGQDFQQVRLRIGGTLWAGNVEVHVRSSDWARHGHHNNKSYDNTVLHVVKHNDGAPLCTSQGVPIPTYILQYPQQLEGRYHELMLSQHFVPCRPLIPQIEKFRIRHFLTRLSMERLEQRSQHITNILEQSNRNWQTVFYRMLFRAFGFGVNADAFEQLAGSIPTVAIAKHRSSLLQLEALLMGQAGLLPAIDGMSDEDKHYPQQLIQEYTLLQAKFGLQAMERHRWKFMRMRPTNFPTLRIAQLASTLHHIPNLFELLTGLQAAGHLHPVFHQPVSDYWLTHYTFGKASASKPKPLGRGSVDRLGANMVVPFMFAYGQAQGDDTACDKAIELLEQLPPESNSKVDGWCSIGVIPDNMFESQALLQLNIEYCDKQRCLQCMLGLEVMKGQ